ncbi:aldo/keto reductase [Amycolatopsis solani]|uniref:aldo/keto reductase n=1 Tax=Amycolatopsis solani TaxID=3028615 RepID=UPI0025AF1EB4|nr:aldo/keto reductase [Amycolatopsis sp. MEP2-6]
MTASDPAATTLDRLVGPTRLVLGTMTFGDTADVAAAARMLDTALDAGVTSIDTANAYAGGTTEEILRDLLRERRERIVLATKAGMPHPDIGEHSPLSAAGLRAAVEGSLRRLGTERVDLLYLHKPDRAAPIGETVETLGELLREGRIGAWGISNYAAWQVAELNHAAAVAGVPGPAVGQQLYNLLSRRIEEEYVEFARTAGLPTIVYNPLGGGLLTGKYSFDEPAQGGRFDTSRVAAMYTDRYWNRALFDAVERLSAIAGDAGIGLVELSLRWLCGRPGSDALLLGGSRVEQLQANIDAVARGPLPDDVVAACDEVGDALRGPMPAYNR